MSTNDNRNHIPARMPWGYRHADSAEARRLVGVASLALTGDPVAQAPLERPRPAHLLKKYKESFAR